MSNFGIPPSTLCRVLKKAEKALLNTLMKEPTASIYWPSLKKQKKWADLVNKKNNLIFGRWGFIDGKNYKVQKPSNSDLQNAMFNGWLHATLITGCFCFGVDGTVIWGRHNFVGSWNDAEMSREFQEKNIDNNINLLGHGVLSDSAFPVKNDLMGRIMTPLKEGDLERASPGTRFILTKLSTAITSMRQSAEWGMGAVEKVYRKLLLPLPFDTYTRYLRLKTIYMLYNFRVRNCKISQIRNYFLTD
jgi:hypothetical protein